MKRIAFIVLVLVTIAPFGAFATGSQEETTAPSATDVTVDPDTGREMIGNTYLEGLPIAKEPVTVEAMVSQSGQSGDILEMALYQQIEAETNVRIRGEFIYPSAWEERKNLAFAGGDLPDIFLGRALSDADIVRYGSQGLLVPLDDLLERFAPNYMAIVERRPQYLETITTPSGVIYTLPIINELLYRENPDNLIINTTWLEALGLAIPETTDEFVEVLRAFRDGDPNGNGEADEIPFSFVYGSRNSGIYSMFGSFGTLDNPEHLNVEDDVVVFAPIQEGYREAVAWFHQLYEEGLIDQEAFTQNDQQFRAKGRSTPMLYGALPVWLDSNEVGPDRAVNDYQAIPPLAGPDGDRLWNRYDGQFALRRGAFAITSATSQQHELLVRWVDYLYEPRRSLEISRGPFGVNLIENADGSIEFAPTPEGMGYGEFRYSNAPGGGFPWAVLSDVYARIGLPAQQLRKLREHYPLYEPYFPDQVYPNLFLTAEQEQEISVLRTDIDSYVEQQTARFIVGDDELTDGTWAAYVDQLDRMGLSRLIEIYQEAYDVYQANR